MLATLRVLMQADQMGCHNSAALLTLVDIHLQVEVVPRVVLLQIYMLAAQNQHRSLPAMHT
jgi:hypothetical protein